MSTYFTILTAIGEAKLANAIALGQTLNLKEMAVGDGNGATPVPSRSQTALVNQQRRALINQIYKDPQNPGQIIAELVLPENVGGWWIRELALYDEDGDMCAVANCPPSYKPQLAEGSGRLQVIRMVLLVSSTDAIQLKIDPSVVLATRKYADDVIVSAMNAHLAAPDPHPQYLTSAEGDTKIAAAIAALINSSPTALDTLAELATALGNDPNFATTLLNALALKAPLASPPLTGDPTAPTQVTTDASTKLATTQFTKNVLSSVGINSASPSKGVFDLNSAPLGAFISVNGAESDAAANNWPLTGSVSNTQVWYNVVTYGVANRVTQRATQVVSASQNQGRTWLRQLQDAAWSAWREVPLTDQFSTSKTVNGYQKLPSGLIIQWGVISGTVTTAVTALSSVLPIAFPNACLAISGSRNSDLSTSQATTTDQVFVCTATTAIVSVVRSAGSIADSWSYIAIGH